MVDAGLSEGTAIPRLLLRRPSGRQTHSRSTLLRNNGVVRTTATIRTTAASPQSWKATPPTTRSSTHATAHVLDYSHPSLGVEK